MKKFEVDNRSALREKVYDIIFESDTPAGKAFDVVLLISIALSVIVVMLDSVQDIHSTHGGYSLSVGMVFYYHLYY